MKKSADSGLSGVYGG